MKQTLMMGEEEVDDDDEDDFSEEMDQDVTSEEEEIPVIEQWISRSNLIYIVSFRLLLVFQVLYNNKRKKPTDNKNKSCLGNQASFFFTFQRVILF